MKDSFSTALQGDKTCRVLLERIQIVYHVCQTETHVCIRAAAKIVEAYSIISTASLFQGQQIIFDSRSISSRSTPIRLSMRLSLPCSMHGQQLYQLHCKPPHATYWICYCLRSPPSCDRTLRYMIQSRLFCRTSYC